MIAQLLFGAIVTALLTIITLCNLLSVILTG